MFGPDCIEIYLYNGLVANPPGALWDIFRFLGWRRFSYRTCPFGTIRAACRETWAAAPCEGVNRLAPVVKLIFPYGLHRRARAGSSTPLAPEIPRDLLEGCRQDILEL